MLENTAVSEDCAVPLREVTKSEIETFHRDGVIFLPQILGSQWVDMVEQGVEAAFRNPSQHSVRLLGANDDRELRIDQDPSRNTPALRDFIFQSPIARIVSALMGSPAYFYIDQLFYREPGPMLPSRWHQDTSYYKVKGYDTVRAWVSPDPVPPDAALEFVRGSHKWNVMYSPRLRKESNSDLIGPGFRSESVLQNRADVYASAPVYRGVLPELPNIEKNRDSFEIIGSEWNYQPGDVLVFHGNTLHGAERSNVVLEGPRRGHGSFWIGRDARYWDHESAIFESPELAALNPEDGQLLSEFKSVFPRVWG